MTAEHFDRTLRALQHRRPFRSFAVVLISGDWVRVDHPEAMVIRSGVAVFLASDSTPWIFDHESVSEFIGGASNGEAKRKKSS